MEKRATDFPSFIDSDKNLDYHQAAIDNNVSAFRSICIKLDQMTDKITKEVNNMLSQRNNEGKTIFALAVEHDSHEVYNYMLDHYPNMDMFTNDNVIGNTPLHHAVLNKNYELVKKLYEFRPE